MKPFKLIIFTTMCTLPFLTSCREADDLMTVPPVVEPITLAAEVPADNEPKDPPKDVPKDYDDWRRAPQRLHK